MRVITGTAKGMKLETLEGMDIRPTTDRVKEAIFSSIQFDLLDAEVLDLFAGSGQLGIEALSRGAKAATFVDMSQKSLSVVKRNLETTRFTDKASVINMNGIDFINTTQKKFRHIFLDPPYGQGILLQLLPVLSNKINENGVIICEYEKNLDLPEKINGLCLKKCSKYGKIKISMYIKDGKEE